MLQQIKLHIEVAVNRWRKDFESVDYWRDPLVAVASARDPLFERLREVVDPDHAMPEDLLADAQSVIAFFFPFERWVGKENDQARGLSAKSWALSYVDTNRLIDAVNGHLKEVLRGWGFAATTTPPTHNFDEEKLVSRWSHKHIAAIAGLGTFGHHHLLITSSGCCGRLGSLVTSMPLPATLRAEREYCLVKSGHRCHGCVSKCRYKALFKTRFDRHACYRQCLVNNAHFKDLPLTDVCGKCACEVPCSHEIPSPPES